MTSPARPIPAARRTVAHNDVQSSSSTLSKSPVSSGLLINVIRTLTSSVSEEQRELEKTKLERGYKESGDTVQRLIKDHQGDIENCLATFKDVSTRISNCGERIVSVRNSLLTCASLLECKRDDLKKLWMESTQQRHIADIMNKLDDLRKVPLEVEGLTEEGKFDAAAQRVHQAKEDLRELECIEGLSNVRVRLEEAKDRLTLQLMEGIVRAVVDEPFERHLSEMVAGMGEERVTASSELSQLSARLARGMPPEPLATRINRDVGALVVLDKELRVLERMNHMSAAAIEKQIRSTIWVMRERWQTDETHPPDKGHLASMIKIIVRQLEASRDAHAVLAERTRQAEVLKAFWRHSQTSVDCVVSEHTGLSSSAMKQGASENSKRLFRFEATACASLASSTNNTRVICRPDVYNIVPLYPWLHHLISTIEESSGVKPCTLAHFVESVVMKNFMGRINEDFTSRLEVIMQSGRSTEALVEGSEAVFEMCSELHHLLSNMQQYSPTLTSLWLLVITEYTGFVRSIYDKATVHHSEVEGIPTARKKISAAWAADEDISRLLMSLPNWQLAHETEAVASPMTGIDSEKEIRERNERESEILMGNLGTQRAIDSSELITSMEDMRRLAVVHESTRSLAHKMRSLLDSIPRSIRTSLQTVRQRYERAGEGKAREGAPLDLLAERMEEMDALSATSLLMLHLELRVHCFFHLLPLSRLRPSSGHDDVDAEVHDLGQDTSNFYSILSETLSLSKLNYIFDGLGHLCAAIFIHSSQYIAKLSEASKKRVCRNIWGVQQRLSQLTGRREAQLDRARVFYELLSADVERMMTSIPQHLHQFSSIELSYLIGIAIRSNSVLATQTGVMDHFQNQLQQIIRQSR